MRVRWVIFGYMFAFAFIIYLQRTSFSVTAVQMMPEDPPTFGKGMWFVKLNTELEGAKSVEAIEMVVAHELAHRVLGHRAGAGISVKDEKAANHLIRRWNFFIEPLFDDVIIDKTAGATA